MIFHPSSSMGSTRVSAFKRARTGIFSFSEIAISAIVGPGTFLCLDKAHPLRPEFRFVSAFHAICITSKTQSPLRYGTKLLSPFRLFHSQPLQKRYRPVRQPLPSPPSNRRCLLFYSISIVTILAASLAVYRVLFHASPPSATSDAPSVFDRGLVKPDVNYREIIRESSRVSEGNSTTYRRFPNPVLAYITPWNSRGYDMAKLFCCKFTHLSPVWYDLKSEGKKLVLDGRHNADMGWISELRIKGPCLVVPRVVLEAVPTDMLRKKKQRSKAIDILVTECKDMGYDGIVLESWSRWAAFGVLHDPDLRTLALQFIKELGNALHSVSSVRNSSHHLELIYVISPPRSQNLAEYDFGPKDIHQLSDSVDGFSLMTYDFSGPQNPGPNAPLPWIRSSLRMLLGGDTESEVQRNARIIFVGINFYGNDYVLSEGSGGGAIIGREYLSLLERFRPELQWEENSGEHFFVYVKDNIRHAVFYPSLMSISLRLEEANAWGTGLSIWEIGQGLDYFFDLL